MSTVNVFKNRYNELYLSMGFDITGAEVTSQIRTGPDHTSDLICSWTVTIENASTGLIKLVLLQTETVNIPYANGFMDIKIDYGDGNFWPAFDNVLVVDFKPTVTA